MEQRLGKWLDSMYNNRALVPDHPEYLQRWAATSARARQDLPAALDLAYGDSAGEKLDIFPAAPGTGKAKRQGKAPVLVFIHGGWWRSLDKSDHSFVAPVFTQSGACVVVPNYTLCPEATIPEITLQMVRALAWTWRNIAQYGGDPSRITVAGHSAGGHLAAMMLACDWRAWCADLPADLVKSALSISGVYDLDPFVTTPFLKDALRLTPADALRASPAFMPAPAQGVLYSVTGADESAEFLRHNKLIQQAWGDKVVPVREALLGKNHFSVVDSLVQPGHRLHGFAMQLLA